MRAVAALAPDGVTVEAFDGLGTLPHVSPDLDTDPAPPPVAALRAQTAAAAAVLVVTPEYAFGMPGVLKNALDWLVSSGHLYQMPIAALSASPSHRGGDRALAWLTQTLEAQQALVPAAATFAVPFVRQVLDGDRVVHAETRGRLLAALAALQATDGAGRVARG